MTTNTTSAVTLSEEACDELQRALAAARREVLDTFKARLLGQTIPHPHSCSLLIPCTITRVTVDCDNFVTVDVTFINPETGKVVAEDFVI